jgi:hypothetical protein
MNPSNDTAQLAERLDAMESRAQIADLIHRYALAVRKADHAAFAPLFTSDASFTVLQQAPAGGAPAVHTEIKGIDNLIAFYSKTVTLGAICPLVYDLLFDIRGDEATASCVMMGAAQNGQPLFLGEYEDTFHRAGEWRFTARTFTMFAPG